jgi:hypothetical protein
LLHPARPSYTFLFAVSTNRTPGTMDVAAGGASAIARNPL